MADNGSLAAFVRGQLGQQGNPNPPGRPARPGQQMPIYQGVPGAPWQGAAKGSPNAPTPKTITAHVNMPSNSKITSSHVSRPWQNKEHELIREGQIMFVRRVMHIHGEKNEFDDLTTEASLQHLNSIAQRGYMQAREALEADPQRLPQQISITAEQFDSISEGEIFDYINRENDIPSDRPDLLNACKLLKIGHFKYLLPIGLLMDWNLYGGVNNISYGTSPMNRVNQETARTIVVNHVVGKDVFLSNIWGDDKKITEGSRFGLVVRRSRGTQSGELSGATEIIPWSDRDMTTPPFCVRTYVDEMGRNQLGYFLSIGTVTELDGEIPAERKRKDAIGNLGKPASVSHDAYGTLPKIRTIWGV